MRAYGVRGRCPCISELVWRSITSAPMIATSSGTWFSDNRNTPGWRKNAYSGLARVPWIRSRNGCTKITNVRQVMPFRPRGYRRLRPRSARHILLNFDVDPPIARLQDDLDVGSLLLPLVHANAHQRVQERQA